MNLTRFFLLWHRKIGLVLIFFILLLAITGILLNHTSEIGLDRIYPQNKTLLNWYHINPQTKIRSFRSQHHQISLVKEQFYLDQQLLKDIEIKSLLGLIEYQNELIVLTQNQLLILNKEGELLEEITIEDGLPENIKQIGTYQNKLIFQTIKRGLVFDIETLESNTFPLSPTIFWSKPSLIPEILKQKLTLLSQNKSLTLEQVILDFHSGRFFGKMGVYIMDFVSLLLLFLSFSGFWMWLKRITNKKRQR